MLKAYNIDAILYVLYNAHVCSAKLGHSKYYTITR